MISKPAIGERGVCSMESTIIKANSKRYSRNSSQKSYELRNDLLSIINALILP